MLYARTEHFFSFLLSWRAAIEYKNFLWTYCNVQFLGICSNQYTYQIPTNHVGADGCLVITWPKKGELSSTFTSSEVPKSAFGCFEATSRTADIAVTPFLHTPWRYLFADEGVENWSGTRACLKLAKQTAGFEQPQKTPQSRGN
jgi:hypothetical protein